MSAVSTHTSSANIQVTLRWYAVVCTPVLLLAIVAESHITRVCRVHAMRLAIVVFLAMVAESHLTLAIVVTASSAKLCDLE